MKDFLQDLVSHVHSLGFLPTIRVTASATQTDIESMAEDHSVVLNAKTANPVAGLDGVFGMPNLNKLDLHLKCPEYKDGAQISVVMQNRNGVDEPAGLHFQNSTGDFKNDYRFMSTNVINEKLKSVKFKGAKWDIEFEPSMASIQRLKFQAAAHTEEPTFYVTTEDGNLVFNFGDSNTHSGSFIFQTGITGKLKQIWAWPVAHVLSILSLPGDISIKIADAGVMQITVNSGVAEYNYILPSQSK